ncbi:Porphobilinogen deaminase [Pseudonocardia dioxanivorans CB1190]|uniref:Porphobilinogen deaminase n=1 Tax=Pseudonocardia dioxanivorans (strain ATCC 55486 / DSM 44775 / JCM 13855 / CB1190) TaxID=675635 RepID=F4CZS0_PSEUX|nr:hydroxymethylbilane synthase [Pseudonocardia dioxanivorans]AEA27746.1 Porphobilinogen deaminase [Pseudonocardia dioxanivorans CB1190]GJF05438.1 porphobilinogen deaminase [Pseudonocardia sp. D17]
MTPVLRIGTRPSALAMAQSGQIADRLRAAGHTVELVPVSTVGDRSGAPVAELGVGVFVSAVRDAVASGEVDVAIHSYKDLPTAPDPRLTLVAVPGREDPRDALVARDGKVLGELPAGSRVGTGSARRTAQLQALGLGLEVVPIRGNVDTRIGKVTSGELDGVIVAAAGLRRLGRIGEATELLEPVQMLPAPAQGALAVECRAGVPGSTEHGLALALTALLDDPAARAAVTAERAVLASLEAGCTAPIGALADVVSDLDDAGRVVDRLSLRAVVGTADGALLRASVTGDIDDAEKLGAALAAELLDMGADTLPGTAGRQENRWIGSSE